jgi:hypothetical protein
MAKSVQDEAKSLIHDMYMANTKESALAAFESFIRISKGLRMPRGR